MLVFLLFLAEIATLQVAAHTPIMDELLLLLLYLCLNPHTYPLGSTCFSTKQGPPIGNVGHPLLHVDGIRQMYGSFRALRSECAQQEMAHNPTDLLLCKIKKKSK